jgi:hypothetical protein
MATKAQKIQQQKKTPGEGRRTATNETSLPSPPTPWFRVVATRQGYPDGGLAPGLDGARPRRAENITEKRERQALLWQLTPPRLPLVGDKENSIRARKKTRK